MVVILLIALAILLVTVLIPVGRKAIKRHKKKMRRKHGPSWSIGVYEGPDPLTLAPAPGVTNPVISARDITDIDARLAADPFMVIRDGTGYLFFEMMNKETTRGEIGLATSTDFKSWRYQGSVLREPFHLSYPYVFFHEGEAYMIPEAGKSEGMHLYKASRFPGEWRRAATIMTGSGREAPLQDPSVILHERRWYLFSYAPQPKSLNLFVAESLEGPWRKHPASPLITGSPHYARPGGRLIRDGDAIYRYSQDSVPSYGSKVWAFRITELTPTTYREEAVSLDKPVIQAGTEGWNNEGMHTVDPHRMADGRWIAIVDGIGNGNGKPVK